MKLEIWRDESHPAQHTTKGNRTKTSGKFKKGLPGWRVRGSGTACAGYGRYPQAQLLPRASSSPPPTPPSPSPSAHGSDQIASRSRKEFASNPRASNFEVVEDYEGGGVELSCGGAQRRPARQRRGRRRVCFAGGKRNGKSGICR